MAMLKPVLLAGLLLTALLNAGQVWAQGRELEEHSHGHEMAAEEGYGYDEPHRQESMLMWVFNSLGWRYTLALPFAGFVSFVLALVIVMRGGPYAGPALMFAVPLPLLVGVMGFFDGMIMSFTVIASSMTAPKPAEVAYGFSTSLVTPVVGMFLMAPAYLVAMGGLFVRTLMGEKTPSKS